MLWLGLSCLSTKSHYICFILFAATSSVSVAAAAACASSTSSRMSSLASFAFLSPTLPLYCLLAYSLFAISAFFLPSISTAWPKYFCLSIYTTYTKINVYIHELTSRTLCWLRPPCPPTPLSTTYLLLTACLVIVLVWPFVSKLLTMDVAK